jgi:hypothetical protein
MLKKILLAAVLSFGSLSLAWGQAGLFPPNTVFAGPASGGLSQHGAPRALVGADLPNPSASTLGGVKSLTCSSHNWFNTLSTSGVFGCAQPTIGDISGFGTGVATALGVNVGSAGAFVVNGGALGTPSSGSGANLTSIPTTGLTGTLQAAQEPAHTGDCTNSAGSLALSCFATTAWTPTVTTNAVAGTPAYSVQVGSYEKYGKQVTVRFTVVLSGWTGSPTGNVLIAGLPFAATATTNDNGWCSLGFYTVAGLAASNFGLVGQVAVGASSLTLQSNSSTGVTPLTAAQAGTTAGFGGMCSYHTP